MNFDLNTPIIGYSLGYAQQQHSRSVATSSPPHFPLDGFAGVLLPLPDGTTKRVDAFVSCLDRPHELTVWIDAVLFVAFSVSQRATRRDELLDGLDTRTWPMDERWYVVNELYALLAERREKGAVTWKTLFQKPTKKPRTTRQRARKERAA